MSKTTKIVIAVVVVSIIAGLGYWYWSKNMKKPKTAVTSTTPEGKTVTAQPETASKGATRGMVADGTRRRCRNTTTGVTFYTNGPCPEGTVCELVEAAQSR